METARRFEVTVEIRGSVQADTPLQADSIRIQPNENGFLLTKTVESGEEILPRFRGAPSPQFGEMLSVGQRVASWAQILCQALSLLKDVPVISILKNVNPMMEPIIKGRYLLIHSNVVHAEFTAEPPTTLLTTELLNEALDLTRRVSSDTSMDVFRRALNWYARGVADSDSVDKFIDHWIALETLSNTFRGSVDPRTCPDCKKILDRRPDRAVLREFLKSLDLHSFEETAMKCSRIRGQMFHEAGAVEEAKSIQPALTNLLKKCFFQCLELGS